MQRRTLVVAVLTYRRPEKLDRGLPLILEQAAALTAGPRAIDASVLVVDNDAQESARSSASSYGARYVCEATPGIAAARNRALDEAGNADVLVFIDDDEQPEPGWLDTLVATWEDTDAGAVMGRVLSQFEHPLPPFVAAGRFFVRRRRATGTRIEVAAAGNLLLDLVQVHRSGVRFDEGLGLGGGEDTLFSRQLVAAGATMVWCDESVAVDFVPAERTTREWVLMRAWSHGLNTGRFDQTLALGSVGRVAATVRSILGGGGRIGVGAARWAFGVVTASLEHRARGLRAVYRGRGLVAGALGRRFEEYARKDAA